MCKFQRGWIAKGRYVMCYIMDQLNYKIEGTEISEKIYAQYGILVLVLILLRISYH